MRKLHILIPIVFFGLVLYAAVSVAPRVESFFDGVVARIDHAIDYPGGR